MSKSVAAAVAEDREYKSVTLGGSSVDVFPYRCVAIAARVTTALSAVAVNICDGITGAVLATIPASSAVGTRIDLDQTVCTTALSIVPGAATGAICFTYKRL